MSSGLANTDDRPVRAVGAEAEFVRTDVRIEEDVRNLVDQTVKLPSPT
jgi:hypothetical protein